MTRLHRLARLSLLAVLALGLAACALPRSGPYYGEITAEPPADLPYEVVRVTPAVVHVTRIDERMGFGPAFRDARPTNISAVAVGDVLSITVWENIEEGLLNPKGIGATPLPKVKVDERGLIYVPYVGLVRAAGKTLAELRETIRRQLAEKTLNPQVDVFPIDDRGRVVSVQGRVRDPGLYPIEPETARLLPMLARAGGVTEEPEVVRLKLRRDGESGEIWVQDLYDEPANNVALGAVGRPATVQFPVRELSVERALGTVSGLVAGAADPTGVFVFRKELPEIAGELLPDASGRVSRRMVYLLDLTQPGGMFLAREFIMRDGDTLYVTTAPFTRWMKILQSVAPLVTFTGSVKSLATPVGG